MGKLYDTTVWSEPDGQVCPVCGGKATHGIGIEGDNVDVDVCDDCAGRAILRAKIIPRAVGL